MAFIAKTAKPGGRERDDRIRVVLARLTGTASDATVLRAAGEIAGAFDAHVRGAHTPLMPPSIARLSGQSKGDRFAGFGLSKDAVASERAAAARAGFESWRSEQGWSDAPQSDGNGPSVGFLEIDGDEPEVMTAQARRSDLSVSARPDVTTLEALLVKSGRPVLVVPDRWSGTLLARDAVLAWNGSAQSARAASGALPLLRALEGEVVILSASERGRPASPEEAAEYLAWHRVRSTIAEPSDAGVGLQLINLARARQAGFIVCGAYAHGPLRQAIFGGVTTALIEHSDVPILFAG